MMFKYSQKQNRPAWKTILYVFCIACIILLSAGWVYLSKTVLLRFPELSSELAAVSTAVNPKGSAPSPRVGTWYSITPVNGFSGNGTGWHGVFRKGSENKVIVYFFGGGVSINEETEKRYSEFFNNSYKNQDYTATCGIGSMSDDNPFKDWSVIGIPYSTGDFHIGTGTYKWKDETGKENIICHYGYLNYKKVMEEALSFIGEPDTLLITGYSAGGFAAALLAEDVINQFPSAENITVCTDSSLLLYDDWKTTTEKLWKAPDEITKKLHSDNILMDSLTALHQSYGDRVKILFDCSVRDMVLTIYQSYIDHGKYGLSESTAENGDIFQNNLKETVHSLQDQIPGCGIFIYTRDADEKTGNTAHMIINTEDVFKPMEGDTSVADWIEDAVDGNVQSYGLQLLEETE